MRGPTRLPGHASTYTTDPSDPAAAFVWRARRFTGPDTHGGWTWFHDGRCPHEYRGHRTLREAASCAAREITHEGGQPWHKS